MRRIDDDPMSVRLGMSQKPRKAKRQNAKKDDQNLLPLRNHFSPVEYIFSRIRRAAPAYSRVDWFVNTQMEPKSTT
jgi:hypothetical protein